MIIKKDNQNIIEIEEEKPKYEITDIILGKGTSGEVFLCNNI